MRFLGSIAVALALTACSSGAGSSVAPSLGTAATRVSAAALTDGHLYVSNASSVTEYALGSAVLSQMITRGIDRPGPLAVDTTGNLYVGNATSITVYARGTGNVLLTIGPGNSVDGPLLVDAKGTVYTGGAGAVILLAGASLPNGFVCVYRSGETQLSNAISITIPPTAMAFGSGHRLYIDDGSAIYVVDTRSDKIVRTITQGVASSSAIAVNADDLYVANDGKNDDVTVYAHGGSSVSRRITKGIDRPIALALDASGQLYVANAGRNAVTVYAPKTLAPVRTIADGVGQPIGLAIDSRGTLYVLNAAANGGTGSVTVYSAGSTRVQQTITKGIDDPKALTLGP